jgi:hypothetical protein
MTGLDPVIHAFAAADSWMAGSSPAMTVLDILGGEDTIVARSSAIRS